VEEIAVFLTQKVFISDSFSVASYKKATNHFCEEMQMKISSLKKQNIDI